MIRFDVITLFPEMFAAVTGSGITGRALQAALWRLQTWNPRDFTTDNYRTVDDRPYGGGPGMVLLAEPLERALDAAQAAGGGRVIYLSAQGRRLEQRRVMELSKEAGLTLLCGRYEGVDERLLARRVDEELSLGDFVLSGGELAAMALIDACVRQVPGALGDERSALEESCRRAARLAALHAARALARRRARAAGAGGARVGPPCRDPALAAEAGAGAHLAETAGAPAGARDDGRGTHSAGGIPARI